jgi:anti-anti-sigma regulatory factor
MGGVQMNTTGPPRPVVTIHAYGDIDPATSDQLRHILVEVIMHHRPAAVIIDLEAAMTLDAATIGVLQAARTAAEDMNFALTFHTSRSALRDQLGEDGIHDGREPQTVTYDDKSRTRWVASLG